MQLVHPKSGVRPKRPSIVSQIWRKNEVLFKTPVMKQLDSAEFAQDFLPNHYKTFILKKNNDDDDDDQPLRFGVSSLEIT